MSVASALKCNNCNLVVNELLTFVQNKHEVMDSESVVRICTSAFSSEEIVTAKSLLLNKLKQKYKLQKRCMFD